jgi:vacuolar-type H+-ATPase subunit H
MDSLEKLNAAVTLIEEARGILEILDGARVALPTDLDQAIQIISSRDVIVEEARLSAEQMISTAREDVARMVEQTSIVQAARDEAQRILDDARSLAEQERAEVESYIDGRLATLEVILNKTMESVARGRERLEGAGDKDALGQLSEEK